MLISQEICLQVSLTTMPRRTYQIATYPLHSLKLLRLNQPAQAMIALKSLVPGAVPVSAVTGLVQLHRTGPVPLHRLTPTLYPASLLVLVAGQRLL